MRQELERAKKIGIAAVLCLATLAIVARLVLQAPSLSSADASATETRKTPFERSESTDLAASRLPHRGRRASAAPVPAVAPSSVAEAASTEADEEEEPTPTILLIGDVIGRPGEILGGPNTLVQVREGDRVRTVPIVRGSFRIEENEPGDVDLYCSAPGFRAETRSITLTENETEHREDFVLAPVWTVAIRLVTDDGRSLLDPDVKVEFPKDSRVEVRASGALPPAIWWQQPAVQREAQRGYRWFPRLRADEEISADPEGLSSGRLEIHGRPPIHVSVDVRGVVLASTRLDTEATTATLEIPIQALRAVACSLRCRIVAAESGAPIPDTSTSVSLYRPSGGPSKLEADANGILEKGGLPPGPCTLYFYAEGRGTVTRTIRLLPSIENDLGTIALDREVRFRGRFVDPEGQTVETAAYVLPFPAERPLEMLETGIYFGVELAAEGGFEKKGLGPDKYVLLSGSLPGDNVDWWFAPVLVDLSHGSVEDLVVRVDRPTTVALHPGSDGVREEVWWVLAPNGILCARGGFDDRRDTTVTLGPGNFRLLVGEDAASVREIPFTVGDSPTTIPIGP